ncbi:B12-binding domain-containing protein [Pseudorhodoplanes sp.]|uniref:cobalamin B12-binding domain-containing protein n=1 Tax=Pseudorhodoplanes sp. TaxID=1934341 RepID=UPI0039193B6A
MADPRQSTMSGTLAPGRDATEASGGYSTGNLLDFPQPRANAADRAALERVVALEILPRIVRAHGAELVKAAPRLPGEERVSEEVKAFCELVLSNNADAASAHIGLLRSGGRSLESIYLELMVPCARYLRRLWDEDVCDFAAATLALWRLQQLLREFSAAFRSLGAQHSCGLRALLAPAPGEKQELSFLMFDLALIAEFFRRDGWDAWIEPDSASVEFSALVRSQWFDVVEFLVSGEKRLDALAARIRGVRRESPNPAVRVLVCGPAFVRHPELILVVGGDMPATDPRIGVAQARNLVGLPSTRG